MLAPGRPLVVAATLALVYGAACARAGIGPQDAGGGGTSGHDGGHPPRPDAVEHPMIDTDLCGNGRGDGAEECDDGDTDSGDGCSTLCQIEPGWTCPAFGQPCQPPVCGDGKVASNEGCDDGNKEGGDGCSPACEVEDGWRCRAPGKPCVPLCGDGKKVGGETCDDNNTDPDDGCSPTCLREPGWDCSQQPCVKAECGNKKVETGESCDEGNA